MHTITIDKECGCFKKSAYENNMKFESKADAQMQADLMMSYMNSKFCGKHSFELEEKEDNFYITRGDGELSGGCCGGGHCS